MSNPELNVTNLSLAAALDAQGISSYMAGRDTSGPAPKWLTENREFRPGFNQDLPKVLNVGADMMIKPVVLEVSGYVQTVSGQSEKVTEYFSLQNYSADSARFEFQTKHSGVRGVSAHPLYDLGRYA